MSGISLDHTQKGKMTDSITVKQSGKSIVIRVGGGWQALREFLDHRVHCYIHKKPSGCIKDEVRAVSAPCVPRRQLSYSRH